MRSTIINKWPGIAPAFRGATGKATTPATTAEDCDLSGGTIRPIMADTTAASGHTADFVKYMGSWASGLTSPLQWMYEDEDVLIYKELGAWKKKVDGTVAVLGVSRPSGPTIEDISISKPAVSASLLEEDFNHPDDLYLNYGTYVYKISFSRILGGQEIEGPLSDPLAATQYYAPVEVPASFENAVLDGTSGKYFDSTHATLRYHTLTRPTIPSGVTHWNVYRSDDGDEFTLLKTCAATGAGEGFDTFTDTYSSETRGRLFTGRPEGEEGYTMSYVITWNREVGSMLDESGPSDPVEITSRTIGHKITRPTSYPTGVTSWRIYRISNGYKPTTEYQLVAEVAIATSYYEDALQNEDLGAAIATSYETASGELINFDAPPVVFDGIMGPHNGMFFGWKDASIYWSEPGKPDVWPYQNRADLPSNIRTAVSNGSELAILHAGGVFRGVGSEPSGFFVTPGGIEHGAASDNAWAVCEYGVFYLSHAGIMRMNGSQAVNISEDALGSDYFDDITKGTAFMEFHGGRIILFHDAGAVVYDTGIKAWSTWSAVYEASYIDRETGILYVLNDGGEILTLNGSDDGEELTYRTGDIAPGPGPTSFQQVELFGTGEVSLTVYVDGTEVASKDMDLDGMLRDRTLRMPMSTRGRALQLEMVGTAEIKEARLGYDRA